MRKLDVLAAVLLVIGGLNWGLTGVADFNLVEAALGAGAIATVVYALVGLAALYQAVNLKGIQRRWGVVTA